jgi:protein-tyrosine phosphatase
MLINDRPSIFNFRDFGGQPSRLGGRVRRDRLFRGGQFSAESPRVLEMISAFDFELIADLREPTERLAAPSNLPERYARRTVSHGCDPERMAPHLALLREETLNPEGIVHYYETLYAGLPFDPLYCVQFADIFTRLATIDGRVLIHCALGKDRTGLLCALILDCLGVNRADILQDYLRSSRAPGVDFWKDKVFKWSRDRHGREVTPATADALLDARASYLERALVQIEREFGSVAEYLRKLGVAGDVIRNVRTKLIEDREP